jgi:hypothetical protein
MNLSRTRLLPLFLLCSLLSVPTHSCAQLVSSPMKLDKPTQAMVFHFFGGTALFYKGYLSERSSLRLGVNVALGYNDDNSERKYRSISVWDSMADTNRYKSDSKSWDLSQQYDFSAIYFYDLATTKWVTVSLGVGPLVGFGHEKYSDESRVPRDTSQGYSQGESSRESMGALAVISMESFVTRNLSVLGQYEILGEYRWSRSSSTFLEISPSHIFAGESTDRARGWEGRLNSVKLGISVYF